MEERDRVKSELKRGQAAVVATAGKSSSSTEKSKMVGSKVLLRCSVFREFVDTESWCES